LTKIFLGVLQFGKEYVNIIDKETDFLFEKPSKMNKNNITIYDIAREAGASPATVSRVLNNSSHPVKQEMRERILGISRQLGYIPNLQARNLKNQTSSTIGIIIPSIENPFYPSIVRGIEDEIVSRNCHMMLSSCDRDIELTNYSIGNMLAVNIQGIISVYMDEVPEALMKLVDRGGISLNVVSNGVCLPNTYTVLVDKEEECALAVRHLLKLGHRRIAFLIGGLDNSIRQKRLSGFQKALGAAGISCEEKYIYVFGKELQTDSSENAVRGYLLTKAMLERTPEVTAFICLNDIMALGALRALREVGKKVPDDYSMISFDDLYFSDTVFPALTTVGLDKYTWGRKLAQYYFELQEHPSGRRAAVREDEVLVPSRLIVRQSTKSRAEPCIGSQAAWRDSRHT